MSRAPGKNSPPRLRCACGNLFAAKWEGDTLSIVCGEPACSPWKRPPPDFSAGAQTLEAIAAGHVTSDGIADYFGISVYAANFRLLRLWRAGRVTRKRSKNSLRYLYEVAS